VIEALVPPVLSVVARTLSGLPRNDFLWAYTIGRGSPYMTRVLTPRVFGRRRVLHRLYRPDAERHPHNHPWCWARFRVRSGGYTEERTTRDGVVTCRRLEVGDVNDLTSDVFHRLVEVDPDTWTSGVLGEPYQDWGFLVDGQVVPSWAYLGRPDQGRSL
jgi:hypothetical protein